MYMLFFLAILYTFHSILVTANSNPEIHQLPGHQRPPKSITEQICLNGRLHSGDTWLMQEETCPMNFQTLSLEKSNRTEIPSHFSWDSEPQCVTATEGKETYCLYSSAGFAQGRGLSILTTSHVASVIAASISLYQGSESAAPSRVFQLSKFYEKELPGRGKGYVSNSTFHKGDLMLTSTPLLIVHEAALGALSGQERRPLQLQAIQNLPRTSQVLYNTLAGQFGGDKTEDVLMTNGFFASFGTKREGHGIVVPEAARLNHDCRPNARFAFDPQGLVHKVHAIRTIQPGDELTFSYIDSKQLFARRQLQIKEHWGFECSCSLCSAPLPAREASDANLGRIQALREPLLKFDGPSLRDTTTEMAVELVKLYEEEGLDGVLAEAYMLAAFRFCTWGKAEDTKRWALKATKHWLVWENDGVTNLEGVRRLSKNPQEEWCWGAKKGAMKTGGEKMGSIWV